MYVAHSALHQGLGGDAAVLCPQLLLQRTAVDADADGNVLSITHIRHGLHVLLRPDVAGVDADGVNTPFGALQGVFVVEMDVSNQRDVDLFLDLINCLRRGLVRDSHPDDLTSGGLQFPDLGHGSGHIVGLRIAHRLDGHRSAAAHGDLPHE